MLHMHYSHQNGGPWAGSRNSKYHYDSSSANNNSKIQSTVSMNLSTLTSNPYPNVNKVDRDRTAPFVLRIFYQKGWHHPIEKFRQQRIQLATQELQVYTWMDVTLRELSDLIKDVLPETRTEGLDINQIQQKNLKFSFRLIYPGTDGRNVYSDIGEVYSDINIHKIRSPKTDDNAPIFSNCYKTQGQQNGNNGINGNQEGQDSSTNTNQNNNNTPQVSFEVGDLISVAIIEEKDEIERIERISKNNNNSSQYGPVGRNSNDHRRNPKGFGIVTNNAPPYINYDNPKKFVQEARKDLKELQEKAKQIQKEQNLLKPQTQKQSLPRLRSGVSPGLGLNILSQLKNEEGESATQTGTVTSEKPKEKEKEEDEKDLEKGDNTKEKDSKEDIEDDTKSKPKVKSSKDPDKNESDLKETVKLTADSETVKKDETESDLKKDETELSADKAVTSM